MSEVKIENVITHDENVKTKNENGGKKMSESSEYTYALLQETSGEESESWYYFIRYQGNEEALHHLQKQFERIEWYLLDDTDVCTFDLELDYLVCEKTAKEMTKVDLNHFSFHRKFDGKLQIIDFDLKEGKG